MRHHSEQIKREVYNLWKSGAGLSDIARDYGLPDTTVRGFIRQIQRLDAKNQHYKQAKKALPSGGVSFVAKEPSPQGSIVLAIPDLHCPFEHPDSLAFLLAVRDKYNPDTTVCLGDEVDFHAFSRFPHDPDGFSVGRTRCFACGHEFAAYSELKHPIVQCPKCEGDCRAGQK